MRKVTRGTRGTKEGVKEDTEAQEVRVTKEEVKEGTRDGTSQEVTKDSKEEAKEGKVSSHTASATVLSVGAKGILPRTAQEAQTR